jgi:hypothetical protein
MTEVQSIANTPGNGKPLTTVDLLLAQQARLERRMARLERLLDEGIGAYLNAKFPYGQATDRWSRRG